MKSNTESTTSSIELRRNERLRVGRTSDELRRYVDDLFSTVLTPEEKSDLIQKAMTTEPSFTNLEQLIFELYH
jgi:hypothetical protein